HRIGSVNEEWRQQLRVDDRGHGTDHAAADVGGESAARTAEMKRKDLGEVLADVTELGDRDQAAEEDRRREDRVVPLKQHEIRERKQNQARNEEQADQRAAGDIDDQDGKEYAAHEPAELLPALDVAARRVDSLRYSPLRGGQLAPGGLFLFG